MNNTENLVIIGSGPAALTAAVYASRANLKPLIIEGKEPGGQLMNTTKVENWPGDISILGPDLVSNLRKHAQKFDTRFLHEQVSNVDTNTKPFVITTEKGNIIKAHAIIIATGASYKKLNCPGEDTYWSKGVTTCAVCDGFFYQDKKVIIVGGGDSSMENASFMTNFTKNITIVHILPELTASHAMQKRVINDPNIKIIYNSTVTEIKGDGSRVTSVEITNNLDEKTTLPADGVFISIGTKPNTDIFKNQLKLQNSGHIELEKHTKTSVDGIFAAGDVADARYRQAITSAGSGCAAALDAERYLKENIISV